MDHVVAHYQFFFSEFQHEFGDHLLEVLIAGEILSPEFFDEAASDDQQESRLQQDVFASLA